MEEVYSDHKLLRAQATILPNQVLLNIMEQLENKVNVYLITGEEIGSIPKAYLYGFDYFKLLLHGSFIEAKTNLNKITLLDSYTKERGQFFIYVLSNIYYGQLELNSIQTIWFCALADDYEMDNKLFSYYFNELTDYYIDINMFNEIIKISNGTCMQPKLKQLFEMTKNRIALKFDIKEIKAESLTYSIGRNFICTLLQTYNFTENETQIFANIIEKVIEINKQDHPLSLKGFYDLLACIKWKNVEKPVVMNYLPQIKEMYSELKMTNDMKDGLNARKNIIKAYNKSHSKTKEIFKYNPKKHGNFDARCNYAYVQEWNSQIMSVYTTTAIPKVVRISIKKKEPSKKKRSYSSDEFLCVEECNSTDKILCMQLTFDFSYYGSEKQITKSWRFDKKLMILLSDKVEPLGTLKKVTFHKVYYVDKIEK